MVALNCSCCTEEGSWRVVVGGCTGPDMTVLPRR